MTQVLEIITQGYRESNLIAISGAMTPLQQAEGLARLQALVASTYGYDVGEALTDLSVGYKNQEAPDYQNSPYATSTYRWQRPEVNTRLVLNQDSAQRIFLPRDPRKGSRIAVVDVFSALAAFPITLDGNGYLIDGLATKLLNINATNKTWMFDDATSGWREITEVTLVTDEMPFGRAFEDYFITKLASRLNSRYGRSLTQETMMRLQEQQEQMMATFRQSRSKPAAGRLAYALRTPNRRFFRGFR